MTVTSVDERTQRRRRSRTAERTLIALERIAACDGPVSLADLARQMCVPKSSLHSVLGSLEAQGFIESVDGRGFRVGLRAFEVGSAYPQAVTVARILRPVLVSVSRELEMTAHFAIRAGADVVYLEKEEPPGLVVRLASAVGARLPAHLTAVGQAILADEPDARWRGAVRLETKGKSGFPRNREEFMHQLALTRRRGYAVDDGETLEPVRCVAASVRASGETHGAIGVSYLRHGGASASIVGPIVAAAAGDVSRCLGGVFA